MHAIFAAIEHWPLSIWMREGPYAYFIALIFHAFGMALLVGGGLVISLRGLGVARGTRLMDFRGFIPVLWLGTFLAVASGALLLSAYPAKAITNPVFAIKFGCLILAALLLRVQLRKTDPSPQLRRLSAMALVLWVAGMAAGKLLLHTYTVLTVG
jgi:hypothetical protein